MASIDTNTKVNLGILGSIVLSAFGGAFWLATMNGTVETLCSKVDKIETAIQSLSVTVASGDKDTAVIEQRQQFILQRIESLERKVAAIEGKQH